MNEDLDISKRQIKTEETKGKLRDAMCHIMDKYDYNTVTIRNICQVSKVAYGSFYNLFESKEEFLRYYLTYDFTEYMKNYYENHEEFEELSLIEKSIDIYVCCAKYNIEKGIKFIRGFYLPNNTSLSPIDSEGGKEYSFTPLANKAHTYLQEAQEKGLMSEQIDIQEIVNNYCYIFNGITFNWCVSDGQLDMVGLVQKLFKEYIHNQIKR